MEIPRNNPFRRLSRAQLAIVAGVVAVAVVVVAVAAYLLNSPGAGLHASLDVSNPDHVRILDPIKVRFDHPVDLSKAKIELSPATKFTLVPSKQELTIKPA